MPPLPIFALACLHKAAKCLPADAWDPSPFGGHDVALWMPRSGCRCAGLLTPSRWHRKVIFVQQDTDWWGRRPFSTMKEAALHLAHQGGGLCFFRAFRDVLSPSQHIVLPHITCPALPVGWSGETATSTSVASCSRKAAPGVLWTPPRSFFPGP